MVKLPAIECAHHYCFDHANEVLMTRLLWPPGHVHVVTGLKFDINGVCESETGLNIFFVLVEWHWHGDRSANALLSVLDHVLHLATEEQGAGGDILLKSENYAGQNKNRFVCGILTDWC